MVEDELDDLFQTGDVAICRVHRECSKIGVADVEQERSKRGGSGGPLGDRVFYRRVTKGSKYRGAIEKWIVAQPIAVSLGCKGCRRLHYARATTWCSS